MKRKTLLKLTAFLIIFVLISSAAAFATAAPKELTVALYPNEPLLSFHDGKADGFIVDLMNEVAKNENWDITYELYNFVDGTKAIESGDVDLLLGVAWSEARTQRFDYNEESVFVNWGQIYVNPQSKIESFQDMHNARVGVYNGDIHYIGENGLKNTLEQFQIPVQFVEYDDKIEIFNDLESGAVEVAIVNRTFGMTHEGSFDIKKTSIQLNPVNLHVIAPKGTNEELLNSIDKYLNDWKSTEDSYYHRRFAYWFESAVSEKIPTWTWAVLAGFAALLILSFIIIYITQKVIHKQTHELKELNHSLEDKVRVRTIDLDATNQQLRVSLITLEEKQSELEEMNAILEEQVEMIERTQGQLLEAEKMASLGRMVSSLAHELNTPLGICVTLQSNMKLDSSKLRKSLDENRLTKKCLIEYLDDMISVSDMFSNNLDVIVDLVDRFKMLSTDRVHMNERKVNLYKYLHSQMDSLSPQLRQSAHEFNIECPTDLDVVLDPSALSQVIRNLTMNSVIHGFEDKSAGKIDIHVKRNDEKIYIEYADNGKGINFEVKDKMFEPFFTTKRNKGGTGLGLSIVHSAVTQSLDGEIRVDERQKNGLKYEIELPLRDREIPKFSVPNLSYKLTEFDMD